VNGCGDGQALTIVDPGRLFLPGRQARTLDAKEMSPISGRPAGR
jgi:hypothetical protein